MKKTLIIVGSIFLVIAIVGIIIAANASDSTRKPNDDAEKDENGRYLTIINKTEQTINKVLFTVDNGTEIESMRQTNPDETSFSVEIPNQYSKYDSFTVILIDRYDLKYENTISNVPQTGRTEVTISQDHYVKQKGDWRKKINKFFNGD